jgi:serine/threonine protein kinase
VSLDGPSHPIVPGATVQPKIGDRVGNYVLLEPLGRGGMGRVFRGENPHIRRQVAIKILSPELSHQSQAAERFLNEGRAVARIRHPSIIDIYDFGSTDSGLLYLVMELLEGHELGHVIAKRGRMAPEDILPYLTQICGALQVAHGHSVVHRDLKPENIFVLDVLPLTLKILDFGLAKLLEAVPAGEGVTTAGMVLGTPLTMAPEQAAGEHSLVGPHTDIYSLGVILYWMLSGAPPFHGEPIPVLLSKHITEPPPPLRQTCPLLPAGVIEVVERCLAKRPSERPPDAWSVAKAFAEAVQLPLPRSQHSLLHATTPPAVVATTGPTYGGSPAGDTEVEAATLAPAVRPFADELFTEPEALEPTMPAAVAPVTPSLLASTSGPTLPALDLEGPPPAAAVPVLATGLPRQSSLSGYSGEMLPPQRARFGPRIVVAVLGLAVAAGGLAVAALLLRSPGAARTNAASPGSAATHAARPDAASPDRGAAVAAPAKDAALARDSRAAAVAVHKVAPKKTGSLKKSPRPEPKSTKTTKRPEKKAPKVERKLGDRPPEF